MQFGGDTRFLAPWKIQYKQVLLSALKLFHWLTKYRKRNDRLLTTYVATMQGFPLGSRKCEGCWTIALLHALINHPLTWPKVNEFNYTKSCVMSGEGKKCTYIGMGFSVSDTSGWLFAIGCFFLERSVSRHIRWNGTIKKVHLVFSWKFIRKSNDCSVVRNGKVVT